MKKPGYMAVIGGEVAYLVKCIPVEVKIRPTVECWNELPVAKGNFSFHLKPRTHILQKSGTQVTCNPLIAPTYMLDGEWYSFIPALQRAIPPDVIKPATTPTWRYNNLQSLATSGIYTQDELKQLRDRIMFPAERPAILNSIARGMVGTPTISQGGSISNLFDEKAINKIVNSAWDRTWTLFTIFGNISAGMIGILLVGKAIKLIFDTVIHGYALHSVYGWSLFLIGAIWDSVTYLLLHLSKKAHGSGENNDGGGPPNAPKDGELGISPPPSYHPTETFHHEPRSPPFTHTTFGYVKNVGEPHKETTTQTPENAPDASYEPDYVEMKELKLAGYHAPPPSPTMAYQLSTLKGRSIDQIEELYPKLPAPRPLNIIKEPNEVIPQVARNEEPLVVQKSSPPEVIYSRVIGTVTRENQPYLVIQKETSKSASD